MELDEHGKPLKRSPELDVQGANTIVVDPEDDRPPAEQLLISGAVAESPGKTGRTKARRKGGKRRRRAS